MSQTPMPVRVSFTFRTPMVVPKTGLHLDALLSWAAMSRAEFLAQQQMYLVIMERIHAAFVKSLGPDEVVALRPTADYMPDWPGADLFVRLAFESIQGHMRSGDGGWLPRIP